MTRSEIVVLAKANGRGQRWSAYLGGEESGETWLYNGEAIGREDEELLIGSQVWRRMGKIIE